MCKQTLITAGEREHLDLGKYFLLAADLVTTCPPDNHHSVRLPALTAWNVGSRRDEEGRDVGPWFWLGRFGTSTPKSRMLYGEKQRAAQRLRFPLFTTRMTLAQVFHTSGSGKTLRT